MAKETKDSELTKKTSTKKSSTSSKNVAKKSSTTAKKTVAKKSTSSVKKSTTTKKATTKKKTATAKKATTKAVSSTTKKSNSAKKEAKKVSSKKTEQSVKKNTTRKKTTKTEKKTVNKFQAEYYDLPYMYNRTIVKVLAQTPKMLFIYWEISEEDRELFQKLYGANFFNHTRPILIVYNDTMNYSFEVEIDDFANSWYLHINDANCEYHVELGRRPIQNIDRQSQPIYIPYYVYVTSSNEMTSPNNTILFNPNVKTIKFKNIKTGEIIEKDIKQFTFITNVGIFTVKELYRYLFPNESFEFENIVLGNTSSGALSSSGMFSSQFK